MALERVKTALPCSGGTRCARWSSGSWGRSRWSTADVASSRTEPSCAPSLPRSSCTRTRWCLAFEIDDARLAAETVDALRPYLQSWAHQYANTLGLVSFAVAVCAAASGDVDDAVSVFESTEEDLIPYGCAGVLPHFRSYFAQVLLRRGSREDRARARALA